MRTLSGGMKRRVLVAQALVHKPPVIVLDEPTAGVDVELRQGLWEFIRRLNRDGHTIVLTTHYLEEAEMHCNRIAMLKAGRIVALDATSELLRRVPRALSARAPRGRGPGGARAARGGERAGGTPSSSTSTPSSRPRSPSCARRAHASSRWSSCSRTWRRCSCRSCGRRDAGCTTSNAALNPALRRRRRRPRDRFRDAPLQGAAALLEGERPDRGRAGAHRAALPGHLRPRRSRAGCRSTTGSRTPRSWCPGW